MGSVAVTVAPTLALLGLVWLLPACCCGGVQPIVEGPPGTITGHVLFERGTQPQPLSVYAFQDYFSTRPRPVYYVMTRVEPPSSTYELAVPPGQYRVIARLDANHTRFAGYTANIACAQSKCGGGTNLAYIRVDSQALVKGIDVGDWGSFENETYGWAIDTNAAPMLDATQPSPTPVIAPARTLPAAPASVLPGQSVNPAFSHFGLPSGWREVEPPLHSTYFQYYSNEPVRSPLELDSNGVWLSVFWYKGQECPDPDWRYLVASTTVQMDGGPEVFYFEDPPSGATPRQPFFGYHLAGGTWHLGIGTAGEVSCVWFEFRGVTRQALESNLATFASILSSVSFAPSLKT